MDCSVRCHYCNDLITGRKVAEKVDGEIRLYHVSVAPLGKNCHNDYLRELSEERRRAEERCYHPLLENEQWMVD